MRTLLTALTFALVVVQLTPALADRFDTGVEAYRKGDYTTAIREWQPLAEAGLAEAQFNLGVMYANGQGVSQDESQATLWFLHAAQQGKARAQYNLGVRYETGQGAPQDDVLAIIWYRRAAEQGYADAQDSLVRLSGGGRNADRIVVHVEPEPRGTPEQHVPELHDRPAPVQETDARALFELGMKYATGQGVPQDNEQAVILLSQAAAQGLAEAQFNLGVFYETGQGLPKDDGWAVEWYRLAADQGYAEAQDSLERLSAAGEPR